MKRILLVAIAILALLPAQARKAKKPFTHETVSIPAVEPCLVAVETEGTSLVFSVRENRVVHQLYYGTRVDAEEFASVPAKRGRYSDGALAYPATGARFLGEPALHLRYADGNHNTELRYLSHETSETQGVVTTTIHLKDYVTEVLVDLVFDAYP